MNRIQKLSLFSAAMIAITAPSEAFAKSKVNTSDSITQEQASCACRAIAGAFEASGV